MIWLRRYPTMRTLAMIFGIHVSTVHKVIHKFLRILHVYLVPKYIRWDSMNTWRNLAGTFQDWPRVVAIFDGTPFRISKPKGKCVLQSNGKIPTLLLYSSMTIFHSE